MRSLLVIAGTLLYSSAMAQPYPSSCWILHDLTGVAYFQGDSYATSSDKFSKPLKIVFNGNKTTVEPNGLDAMMQIDEFMAFGIGKTDTFATVEVYQVDPTLGVALYTKSITAKSILSGISGTRAFTGRAERC